ncbi:MAG: aminomethyl-transferring glycine dehydrogenase [Hydrogenophilales bacterium CG03_land_8_20_14_0_80_62_28]|nr:aminomethyl-transferring glycine dehydrogenase subunit GcvPA [Betaproteobacteria bacterium]OIO78834.1 MAG: glycine dehydrogenase (aminomethyl-transferring) [Hydrogenophilaceae bacterium CG1_02_62_390]PIV23726.1 MAG: aminomethyl-transferring glycine dehydrogenase [Hydrogenophilales bacterium CG03_land_8_20_14_0_80_62_28]PIW38606.1 MAG: aminomethyl-transferring glycine dehydrogenase [Hydrogenophilales bacterium CG15_BIG_FIL_POST_REV_8_21_14_020_62_31]PIW71440.1 MAG: aminomethyl-transferring gl
MPFIPHTSQDVAEMLASIGAADIEALFDEIPAGLRCPGLADIPEGESEMAVTRRAHELAALDGFYLNFIGAGAYEHHIPAAVWQIAGRGEYYTAYTPYQAEASQGTLQLIYEYQTMMTRLTGLDVSNASLYDGATALAEAVLMAVRASKGDVRRVLLPATVHPRYRAVVQTMVKNQGVELTTLPYDPVSGQTRLDALDDRRAAALVIPQPNFFGVLEPVDALTDWAHDHGLLAIALVNPMSLALLKAPGAWGAKGVDICVGDGQPLGIPLSSGGPYFGFMTCRQALVRQMPGRLVGATVDRDGRRGYVLTLQAREQHIRRAKATSNICSNQGLMVVAATLHMALLGPAGLNNVALASHGQTRALLDKLTAIDRVKRAFTSPFFHEAAVRVDGDVEAVLRALRAQGILGGYALGRDFPELADVILFCATETKTDGDLEQYAQQLARILSKRREAPPCAYKS